MFGRIADDGLIRALDIVGALLALALAFPVMVLVALAVKVTSAGPMLQVNPRSQITMDLILATL